jgi:hypothetical protein
LHARARHSVSCKRQQKVQACSKHSSGERES